MISPSYPIIITFFDEHLKSLYGSEVGIEEDLGEGAELRGPVPAIGAVDERVEAVD